MNTESRARRDVYIALYRTDKEEDFNEYVGLHNVYMTNSDKTQSRKFHWSYVTKSQDPSDLTFFRYDLTNENVPIKRVENIVTVEMRWKWRDNHNRAQSDRILYPNETLFACMLVGSVVDEAQFANVVRSVPLPKNLLHSEQVPTTRTEQSVITLNPESHKHNCRTWTGDVWNTVRNRHGANSIWRKSAFST